MRRSLGSRVARRYGTKTQGMERLQGRNGKKQKFQKWRRQRPSPRQRLEALIRENS